MKSKIQQAPTLILENSTAKDGNLNKLKLNLIVCLSLFYLAPAQTAFGQEVVFNTRADSSIGTLSFTAGDLIKYDPQTNAAEIFFPGTNFTAFANNVVNLDALSIRADGTFIFSAQTGLIIDGVSIDQRSLVDFNPLTREFDILFRQNGVDISGLDILDDDNVLLAAKQDAVIAGLQYNIGDVIKYTFSTSNAETFFSADNFLTVEEGGRFTAPANIDAVELLENGNLLFSTTNETQVEFGTDPDDAVMVEQESVYEYDFATGETTLFFDGSQFNVNTDLKSFSLLPEAVVVAVPEPASTVVSGLAFLILVSRRRRTSL